MATYKFTKYWATAYTIRVKADSEEEAWKLLEEKYSWKYDSEEECSDWLSEIEVEEE